MRLEVSHQDHSLLLLCWLPRAQDSEPSFFPEQTFSFFPLTNGYILYQNCCYGRLGTQFLDFSKLLSNWLGKIRVSFFIIQRISCGYILRLWKVLFLFNLLHSSFSVHWRFLPESMITLKVEKWRFCNPINPCLFVTWHSVRKNLYFFCMYLLTYLLIYLNHCQLMHSNFIQWVMTHHCHYLLWCLICAWFDNWQPLYIGSYLLLKDHNCSCTLCSLWQNTFQAHPALPCPFASSMWGQMVLHTGV